ncbi:hypothetical protein LOZ12_005098 [Ophidiomyces ophidiicola]|uniref:Uncharacterized protein n=1 Tax=Ophidiomyces ophidiicola TaxID=1387563 RepID=A0ACB8UP02_9EURO|nr:hypothetical protein LOZ64_005405 [Ophidiomyces ophidiicola]KAI1916422.1 hypothetical protein LOZ61_001078 [Ophidiomyces ophidiicola]KAI1928849.1 hypothetical protein LOZ60_002142 [Ophidiomyces ophidiicola]KAI1938231.1 hypothetical protein LOZ62_005352 [Ophidiomyces ophidiicola]KAI1960110.1 hypothetical protein LOZ59_002765 [Ophidiomyces ophidiicola]
MPRPCHPQALFSLVPLGDRAGTVLQHPDNSHLVSTFTSNTGEQLHGIDIGFHIRSSSCYTLATLGRNGADITVDGSSISRMQCSFEVHNESGVVLLYDRSHSMTTQVSGSKTVQFESGRSRRVVVSKDMEAILGFGGVRCDLYKFQLIWHKSKINMEEEVGGRIQNLRLARTADEPTDAHSYRLTRIHTPNKAKSVLQFRTVDVLGEGKFGTVWKAIDLHSGGFLAVKFIKNPTTGPTDSQWIYLKREIEALSTTFHPHIVEYIHHQMVNGRMEICTALKDGNLDGLISQNVFQSNTSIEIVTDALLPQMLQALDYLAYNSLIHRDVKPANILYVFRDNKYLFQLADFGLCNFVSDATSYAGSPFYMAPEILRDRTINQTPKVDVWSLFVTVAFALNANGYRKLRLKSDDEIILAAAKAADASPLKRIKDMAIVDPTKRASAAQMLLRLYNGVGLTTPRSQIDDGPPPGSALNALVNSIETQSVIDTHDQLRPLVNSTHLQLTPGMAAAGRKRQRRDLSRVRKPGAQGFSYRKRAKKASKVRKRSANAMSWTKT